MSNVYEDEVDGRVVARLDDTAHEVTRWDADGQVMEGYPRPYNSDEELERQRRMETITLTANERALLSKAQQALTVNLAWLNRSQTPTNAQVLDQIDRMTRQLNALIKLVTKDFLNTEGT